MGTQTLKEQRCFNYFSVSIYRLWYKKFLSTIIKIRKSNVQQPLPREQGINNGHKVRRQSISQERGLRLSSFVVKRMFTKGDSSLSHTMTTVPGSSVLLCLKETKDLWETACRNPPVKHSPTIVIYTFFFSDCAVQHMGSWFPDQGWNLSPLQWKHGVLIMGPLGKPHSVLYLIERMVKYFSHSWSYWIDALVF